MKSLNLILQSLKHSNYLKGLCVVANGKNRCESYLLNNGLKLREQLLKQLVNKSSNWSTQCGGIREIGNNRPENNKISFLQRIVLQNSHQYVYNEQLVNMANVISSKIMQSKSASHFVSENSLFYGSNTQSVLVTDFFVAAENDLFRYNNLQRERKVWWMKFSANPSRYCVEPCQISSENDDFDTVCKNSKSVTIEAKYTYGSADVETLYLIPLHKLASFACQFGKISLLRSVINLDLAAGALILDSSVYRSGSNNFTLMLNRKLAPYHVLLARLHDRNKTVDELTTHLEQVISRRGVRLYDRSIHANIQMELETKLLQSDCMGIPYVLVIDDESTKSGLIRIRSRDTTLFEIIHISDIPNYLINSLHY